MLISMSAFAKEAKVSRQAISKACKAGALVVRPDKKLDTTHPINSEYIKNKKTESENKHNSQSKISNSNTSGSKKDGLKRDNNTSVEAVDIDGNLSEYSKFGLDRIKTIRQIKKLELEDKIKRDSLVEKALIKTVFARLIEIHMNEFLTIKEKLIPDISALFEISDPDKAMAAGERMDEELWKVLNHIKSTFNKFLNEIKEGELD